MIPHAIPHPAPPKTAITGDACSFSCPLPKKAANIVINGGASSTPKKISHFILTGASDEAVATSGCKLFPQCGQFFPEEFPGSTF